MKEILFFILNGRPNKKPLLSTPTICVISGLIDLDSSLTISEHNKGFLRTGVISLKTIPFLGKS